MSLCLSVCDFAVARTLDGSIHPMFHASVSTGATETLARGERIIVPICFKAAFGAFLYRIACNLTNI